MGNSSSHSVVDSQYNAKTEAENVARDFASKCRGRSVIITGANTGLGFETARVLAKEGADVVICSRSQKNGDDAVKKIKDAYPDAKVMSLPLDLSSLASIDAFVESFLSLQRPLDILINNAGVMGCEHALTTDGFEMQMGTNHVGHFHLTMKLLPLLRSTSNNTIDVEPARIVNLSSLANYIFSPSTGIDDIDNNFDGQLHYDAYLRYGESKLANILFTRALNRRLLQELTEATNKNAHIRQVVVVSVHPGVILGTELIRHLSVSIAMSATYTLLTSIPFSSWSALLAEPTKTIAQGAATTVRCALDPLIVSGEHYADGNRSLLVHPMAENVELQEKLWNITENRIKQAIAQRVKNTNEQQKK